MPASPVLGLLVASLLTQATPFPFEFPSTPPTLAPATPTPLPEIGRVRASPAACAAIRDLVVPSVLAVRRADQRYADVAKRLRQYVAFVDDEDYKTNTVYRETALARLDEDNIAMRKEALVLNRALGDPRISEEVAKSDKSVAALRAKLEQLYEAQAARANLLQEYVVRERVSTNKADMAYTDPFGGTSRAPAPLPTATPMPGMTPPPFGMPPFHGMSMADTAAIDKWARGADATARAPEYDAAKTFATVAQRCRPS